MAATLPRGPVTVSAAAGEAKTIPAGKFKAKCLAIMDEVQARREPVTITKNGKAVAQLVPMPLEGPDPIFGFYKGKLKIVGDIMAPMYTEQEYEEFYQRSDELLNDRS